MGDPPIRLEISESDPLEPNMTFWGNFAIFETTAKNSVLRFEASGRPRGWRKVAVVPEMEPVDRYVSLTTLDEAKKKKERK